MKNTVAAAPRRWARVAGLFYLITIAAGVFAEMAVRGALVVRDDATATASNILAHESLYRAGLGADLVMLAAYVVVTVLFYRLFTPAGRSVALIATGFSFVGIAILAVNCLNYVAPLLLLGNEHYLSVFDTAQAQALALFALKLYGRGYVLAIVFFGTYCVLIGYLLYRSRLVPRTLGALMVIGGAGYLVDSFALLLFPAVSATLPDLSVLGAVAELALSLWLVAFGIDTAKWGLHNASQVSNDIDLGE